MSPSDENDRSEVLASSLPLEELIHSARREDLALAAADPTLTEDLALALLKRSDLHPEILEQLAKNRSLLTTRKVALAVAAHPQTPRQVSMPLVRRFYTLNLMKIALSPTVPADVKRIADETLLTRITAITSGERLTLARQASGKIAGALLLDTEARIMRTALENARLTEAAIVQAVLKAEAGVGLIQAVAQHAKWSHRRDVQSALLRTEHLSLARALSFARMFSPAKLREILQASRLPARVKQQLVSEAQKTLR